MKPYLILSLVTAPFLAACVGAEGLVVEAARVDAQPRPTTTSPPGTDAEWVTAVVSAKASGSLYRNGAFFHPFAADANPALALP
jgi:hypothetical protein